jgi:hypothetical protein
MKTTASGSAHVQTFAPKKPIKTLPDRTVMRSSQPLLQRPVSVSQRQNVVVNSSAVKGTVSQDGKILFLFLNLI